MLLALEPNPGAAVTDDWVQQWRADLAFARDTLPEVHPNLYATVTAAQFEGAIDSLSIRIPDLSHHEITVELMRIVAMVHDGHTRLTMPLVDHTGFVTGHSDSPPPKDAALLFRHYPIRLYLFSDGLFVTRIGRPNGRFAGARLVRIGAMEIDDAISAVTPTIQRDNSMQIKRHLPEHLVIPEVLQARGVIDDMENAAFVLQTEDGERHTVTLSPVAGDSVEWVDAAPVPSPLYLRDVERNFWFDYLADSRTVYWQYNTVYDEEDETVAEFSDRLLAFVESHPVERVVIDLRHNFGGSNGLNLPLLHMLICCTKTREPGTLYAIVGRQTFSAAMMFSLDLEKHTSALFVGEPTGSTPNHFGDSRKIQLPNTGLTVRVSTLYWQNAEPQDDRPWIEPNMTAELSAQDFLSGRDPALDAVLAAASPVADPDPAGTWAGRVVDFRVAIHLEEGERGWSGTLDVPALGATNLPLDAIRVTDSGVHFVLPDEDGDVTFEAAFRGAILVGNAVLKRRNYPFALVRVPD